MSSPFDADATDDLVRLWQESVLPAPDPERLARSVGRMALRRFDRLIFWRNFREYAGFVALVAIATWQLFVSEDRVGPVLAITGGLFVVSYLWRQHRNQTPLDPSADGRVYQAALLQRIDDQIRLLGSVRYWYLLPLYLPVLWTVMTTARRRPVGALIFWVLVTAFYALLAWLNERAGVNYLRRERNRVESLYEEDDPPE